MNNTQCVKTFALSRNIDITCFLLYVNFYTPVSVIKIIQNSKEDLFLRHIFHKTVKNGAHLEKRALFCCKKGQLWCRFFSKRGTILVPLNKGHSFCCEKGQTWCRLVKGHYISAPWELFLYGKDWCPFAKWKRLKESFNMPGANLIEVSEGQEGQFLLGLTCFVMGQALLHWSWFRSSCFFPNNPYKPSQDKDLVSTLLKVPEFGHTSGFLAVLFFHFSKVCKKVLSRYFRPFCGKMVDSIQYHRVRRYSIP